LGWGALRMNGFPGRKNGDPAKMCPRPQAEMKEGKKNNSKRTRSRAEKQDQRQITSKRKAMQGNAKEVGPQ